MLGRFPALAGADLDVDAGEIVLVSGANGAGKTTLLRLCAGLLPLRSGHAEVLGVDLAVDRRAIRRAIALVGHDTACYDDLNVRENVRFVTRAAGRTAAEADAGLDEQGRALLDDVVRAAPGEGRTVLLASHELQRARPLATREVRIAAGQVHDGGAPLRAVPSARAEASA